MSRGELFMVMTGGMATIAGGVLVAYIGILGGNDPVQKHAYAKFRKVTAFRLNGVSGPDASYEDMNFVDNVPQMMASI